jgi:predicted membrane chloride channel (bestrophin family)
MIWVTFLPLALWPSLDWVSIIVTPIIVFLSMGLENIGVQIEEPFRILPILVRRHCR